MERKIKHSEISPRGNIRGGGPELIGKQKMPETISLDLSIPWYRQDGFKTRVGAVLMIGGLITKIFNPAGQTLIEIGSVISGIGLAHGAVKSSPKHKNEKGLAYLILTKLAEIIKIILSKK